MRTLFLHIGHGKTGSTWIQSSLRLSRAALAARGIDYPPEPGGETDDPARITSGNGLVTSEAALSARLAGLDPGRSALFSNEALMHDLHDGAGPEFLGPVARRHGFDRVALLLFVRDPLGHAASRWGQWVKDRGLVAPIEEHFAAFDVPERAARLLDRLEAAAGVEVTVRNYSRCRDRLPPETAAWLEVPEAALTPPPGARVNRSLTRAETALQRALNRELGPCPRLLAYPLIERPPELEADDLRPSAEVQAATWERLRPAVEGVDARLPEAQRHRRDLRDPAADPAADLGRLAFSPAQVELIAERLGGEIARLRRENARLRRALSDPASAHGARQLSGALLRRLGRRLAGRPAAPASGDPAR